MERFIIRKTTRNIKLKKETSSGDDKIIEREVMSSINQLEEEEYESETEEQEPIYVYTDGACSNNGRTNARAGFGVYFGKDDPRNVSESYNGPQTNNVAELLAIIKALSILRQEIDNGEKIVIYSDSKYSIRCCTDYGEKCEKNNWIKKKGVEIPNAKIVKVAYGFCKGRKNIEFIHINAHTGLQDRHSLGNENADRLANLAIGQTHCSYQTKEKKIYLNVPYGEKDEAKKWGARWDAGKKKWFIENNNRFKTQAMARWAANC
jgi:ribonuclease HI